MNRTKRLKLNTITSLVYQIFSLISGFVLPRLVLFYYGSEINGLLSSITQFLSIITLCECGVGAVVQSSLYKPISDNDNDTISRIFVSANKFFRIIAIVLCVYVCFLVAVFPRVINNLYDFWFTAVLIIAIAISLFAQYYLGIIYKLIINAAQLVYVQMIVGIIAIVLNVATSIVLMVNGFSIQIVKVSTSIIFLIQPVVYKLIVDRQFLINKKIKYDSEPIQQKWNGLSQHIATVVLENTDVIVLTTFSSLSSVSVYSVYHLVANGIKLAFVSLTTGMKSLLGDMYARQETRKLLHTFSLFEFLTHTCVTFIYSVAAMLIVPFVCVYTNSITDANYSQPVFGIVLCLAMMVYLIRIPYSYMILAAGHYKQTQKSALIEAGINVLFSLVFVSWLGLVGVAIGTLLAMLYRTVFFVLYLRKDILNRAIGHFIKHIVCDGICFLTIFFSTFWIPLLKTDYLHWFLQAVEVAGISLIEVFLISFCFYRKEILLIVSKLKKVKNDGN